MLVLTYFSGNIVLYYNPSTTLDVKTSICSSSTTGAWLSACHHEGNMDKQGYIPALMEVHITHSQYKVTNDMCWEGKHVTDLEQDRRKQSIQDGSRVGGSYIHFLPGPNWNYT